VEELSASALRCKASANALSSGASALASPSLCSQRLLKTVGQCVPCLCAIHGCAVICHCSTTAEQTRAGAAACHHWGKALREVSRSLAAQGTPSRRAPARMRPAGGRAARPRRAAASAAGTRQNAGQGPVARAPAARPGCPSRAARPHLPRHRRSGCRLEPHEALQAVRPWVHAS